MAMAMEAAQGSESKSMDPKLWGNLQHYVSLEWLLYVKLPIREFFQNRLVCKEWNRLAGDREFLEESSKHRYAIPEPFFFLESWIGSGHKFLLLGRDHLTGVWSTTRMPSNLSCSFQLLQWSQGLVLYKMCKKGQEDQLQVFDIDTRVVTCLPPRPQKVRRHSVFGMVVDRSVRPCAWKLVQGSRDTNTQIFDSRSNTWIVRPSRMPEAMFDAHYYSIWRNSGTDQTNPVAYANGVLYIQRTKDILIYVMESADIWIQLQLPWPVPKCSYGNVPLCFIGAWQERIFSLTVYRVDRHKRETRVWELVGDEWTEFSCMPIETCCWLDSASDHPFPPSGLQIRASYCNGFFLVHAWLIDNKRMICKAERFALFNMATKVWQKLEMPFGGIHMGDYLYCKGLQEPPVNYQRYPWYSVPFDPRPLGIYDFFL
jgi:hypothetical protein